jgi:hypothetical protein
LLAFYTTHELVHPLAKHLLGRIEQDLDPLEAWCSTVTLMELLVRPTIAGPRIANTMLTSLTQFPHLHLAPVDEAVAVQATELRARDKVTPADALIVATWLVLRCEVIISNGNVAYPLATHRSSFSPSMRSAEAPSPS